MESPSIRGEVQLSSIRGKIYDPLRVDNFPRLEERLWWNFFSIAGKVQPSLIRLSFITRSELSTSRSEFDRREGYDGTFF